MNEIVINKFLLDSGERYCIVINKGTGMPLFYPNLYLTTQFRNRGYAVATIESIAVNISLFYRFIEGKSIDIEAHILSKRCLSGTDIDQLAIFLFRNSNLKKGNERRPAYVSKKTLYVRLNNIAAYLLWLSEELLQYNFSMHEATFLKMVRTIKGKSPRSNAIKNNVEKSLSDKAVEIIMEIIKPSSPNNPFESYVRKRNEMIIIILFELGIRCGELLNIKIGDIDFQNKRLLINRRADEKSDSRLKQPLVKTLGRALSLSDGLAWKLSNYIIHDRKSYAKGKTDYLFISYKSGPSKGKPLTISGYHKMISKISACNPLLNELKGHQFRHRWNYDFSKLMDSQPEKVSEVIQEKIRNHDQGWSAESGTAKIYNERFIKEKANEASIRLQEKLSCKYRGK